MAIVVLVASISDYRKQGQFRLLNEFGQSLDELKVLRKGNSIQILNAELVVGDVVHIQTGDILPADGVLIEGFDIETDESTMTGEPYAICKSIKEDPFLLSGTKVVKGVGKMVTIATGLNSLNGRSLMALEVEPQETPLQQKLGVLADVIAKFAFWGALSLFVVLLIIYFAVNNIQTKSTSSIVTEMIKLFILAVTVVVVAVPEGLPLAVTLSLAHATIQMLKDNNLVRNLSACETMGNATTICSDKTGTLTMNKMSVVRGCLLGESFAMKNGKIDPIMQGAKPDIASLVAKSLNVNSTAGNTMSKEGVIVMKGSKTEIAILEFFTNLGYPFEKDREACPITRSVPFSSESKRMSCIVNLDHPISKEWMFVKGASEIILKDCSQIMTGDGNIIPLDDEQRTKFQEMIASYADDALRTIGAALKPVAGVETVVLSNGDLDTTGLVFLGIFGIEDPLRPEVVGAVASCQSAGVLVRMVTGDSVPTAKAIARGCGILSADGIVMEGPAFRLLTESEMDNILPKLQVLARSSPLDKQILVKNLKRLGETVAVTGGAFAIT